MNDVKVFAKNLEESARLRSCLSDDAENARLIMGENEKLRELCEEMFAEHRRLYYSQGFMRGQSASSRQMARWHEEGTKLGLDVWGERKEVDE